MSKIMIASFIILILALFFMAFKMDTRESRQDQKIEELKEYIKVEYTINPAWE